MAAPDRGKEYALYSEIKSELEDFPLDKIYEFILRVERISKAACPVKTGRLRNSFYTEVEERGDDRVSIRFGYYAKDPQTGAEYAMPADYYTGGRSQRGFFSGAVRLAFAMMRTKKSGEIDKNADVRGANTGEDIVLPGRT